MLKCGWSSLWQQMVAQDKLDVRLRHDVTSIKRDRDGVTVTGTKDDESKEAFEVKGTHVFIACPYQEIKATMELTPEEKRIIDVLEPFTLCTTLYQLDTPKRDNTICYWPDVLHPDTSQPGMLNCERHSDISVFFEGKGGQRENPFLAETAEPELRLPAAEDGETKKQVRCSYQFLDVGQWRDKQGKVDDSRLLKVLEESLSSQGDTGVKIMKQYPWNYFYHFSQKDLDQSMLWDLVAMQGDNRTFFIGASAVFESVHDVTNYNKTVFDHFFGKGSAAGASA